MQVFSRRVTMLVELDLPRGSKEAHEVTVRKIAQEVGKVATSLMEERGYTVSTSNVTLTMHTVRHVTKLAIKKAVKSKKRLLKAV
jgi:alpha-L-arabinofuranosidase